MIMQKHLSRMTLREKLAQRVFIDFRFDDADYERTIRLVKKEGVGGLCLFGGSVFDVPGLVNSLQRVAKFPLLVASDYENGAGHHVAGATLFPPNMALGAADSEELAQLKGRHTGLEARALGVRWVLGPVLDVNTNPLNPVINTRSFGDDPARVTRLARAFLKGLHSVGTIGCAKHFPGHGGAAADSHLELPVLEQAPDLRPYAELAGEADAVMTGHLLVKSVDAESPASLSSAVTGGLLRGELKFDGLVITDALVMGGVTKHCGEAEAVKRAAAAGADVLLYPGDPDLAIHALEEAVKEGRVTEASVDHAVERILSVKDRLGLFAERLTDVASVELTVGGMAPRAAAQRIAEASMTLVRGSGRVEGSAALLKIQDDGSKGDLSVFEAELGKRVTLSDDAATCVIAVFFRPRAFSGRTGLEEAQVARIREAQKRYKDVILVAFGSPYVLRQAPDLAGFVCAWGEDLFSQRAAAKALTGAIEYKGRLPVDLGVGP